MNEELNQFKEFEPHQGIVYNRLLNLFTLLHTPDMFMVFKLLHQDLIMINYHPHHCAHLLEIIITYYINNPERIFTNTHSFPELS